MSANVLLNRIRRPIRGLTEDWIKQHTANDLADAEKANWFGDSNDEAENSSLSSSISGELEDWVTSELDPRTPTLKSFIDRREEARRGAIAKAHRRLQSGETITPEDFRAKAQEVSKMSHSRKKSSIVDLTGLNIDPLTAAGSNEPVGRSTSPEKPLPLPPKDVPAWRQAAPLPPPKEEDENLGDRRHSRIPSKSSFNAPEDAPTKQPQSPEAPTAALSSPPRPANHLSVSASPPLPTPRMKKKVPWKAGKNIMVLLPTDEDRGKPGKAPKPLTTKEVDRIYQEWEQLGYDTTGFRLDQSENLAGDIDGQSKSIWPDGASLTQEKEEGNFKISIPDKSRWDEYVNQLAEAKLRALGVSFGDEDPVPVMSPLISNTSRQASMQYPALPFSPPIPTSSANSSHIHAHQNPFSPVLMPGTDLSTSQSSNVGSVASPPSMHASMYGKFNPRQSISLGPGQPPFGSPFQFPQQQSPGVWSPPAQPFTPGHLPRGASPSMSFNSSFGPEGYFPQNTLPMQVQLQQRQQELQAQLQQMQRQSLATRATPVIPEVQEDDAATIGKSPSKTPEAFAQPKTKHNASDSLQREIDDAEYHLEEQFQRQLEHADYSPHSEKNDSKTEVFGQSPKGHSRNQSSFHGDGRLEAQNTDSVQSPKLHHPQPHSRGHSLSQRPFDNDDSFQPSLAKLSESNKLMDNSERETDQSVASGRGSPEHAHKKTLSTITNPWAESDVSTTHDGTARRSSHSVKPSLSKLNVEAPEFKFNPEKTLQPAQFTFPAAPHNPSTSVGNAFDPSASTGSTFSFQAPIQASNFSQSVGARSFNPSKSQIHADAPAFKPGQSVFSFSTSGPTFRPDAPTFKPSASNFGGSVNSLSGTDGIIKHAAKPSIFGNIDLSLMDIIKPPKKSKAVPIIRPDSTAHEKQRDSETDTVEGKDGRITQGQGRIKRSKAIGDDGDSVPLFAEPSGPLQETSREQSPPKENASRTTKPAADKENMPDDSVQATPVQNPAVVHTRNILEDSPDYDGKSWAPWDVDHHDDVSDTNEAKDIADKPQPAPFKFNPHAKPVEFNFNAKPFDFNASTKEFKPGHGKRNSSLSALAKPFEFGSLFKFGQTTASADTAQERPAPAPVAEPLKPASTAVVTSTTKSAVTSPASAPRKGLMSSRFAASPSPKKEQESPVLPLKEGEQGTFERALPRDKTPTGFADDDTLEEGEIRDEPTFEEIDDVMRHMHEQEMERAASRQPSIPMVHQPSPMRHIQIPDVQDNSSPIRLAPQFAMRSDAPSPSPGRFNMGFMEGSSQRAFSAAQDDPFVEQRGDQSFRNNYSSPIHHLNATGSIAASDWDDVLSVEDEAKFEARTQFFDGRVNELVGGIVTDKLMPMNMALQSIQHDLHLLSNRGVSNRRTRRSMSAELPESDADDEDELESAQRSLSPRRDNKMDKIRRIIQEALASHGRNITPGMERPGSVRPGSASSRSSEVLKAIEEMRGQIAKTNSLTSQQADLSRIVEEALQKHVPAVSEVVVDQASQVKIEALEASLSDMSQRTAEMTERFQRGEEKVEEEVKNRRAAEDRLAEVQRLLRISAEEEDRLREVVVEKDARIKELEDSRARVTVKTSLLEATADSAQKNAAEIQRKFAAIEDELREARQNAQRWQTEAEQSSGSAQKYREDAQKADERNSILMLAVEKVRVQMQESVRTREAMRKRLTALQQNMTTATQNVAEENAKRFKKEQELVARQEVLDAKLQAEARTRERLEAEIERLEDGERAGMRAIKESKGMEDVMATLRMELDAAERHVLKYKREFEEARESGITEAQRIRLYMQAEVETANHQVNLTRQDFEDQLSRKTAELDSVRLDIDTTKAQMEMLVEELKESKQRELSDLKFKYDDHIEDLNARHERQLSNALEDASRSERHWLERINLSAVKTEHLQDRVAHLEEKLEIAKEAALAAAQSARSQTATTAQAPSATPSAASAGATTSTSRFISTLPEKISPQALRESIIVLQEQLQERESTIEQLNSKISKLDPDSATKIQKRDDEINWLRELLAVRQSDLQDIITTISQDQFDAIAVKDAAIRLKANLQMEEQERTRALNGGSSILPSALEARLKEAASSPRVAQVVGPVAAAWGNWRAGSNNRARGISEIMNSEGSVGTPTKASRANTSASASSGFLSGLLTPPSAGAGRTPQNAFGNTGRRFTAEQLANRPKPRGMPPARAQSQLQQSSKQQASRMPGRNLAQEMAFSGVRGKQQPSTSPLRDLGAEDDFGGDGFFDDDVDDVDAGEIEDSILA